MSNIAPMAARRSAAAGKGLRAVADRPRRPLASSQHEPLTLETQIADIVNLFKWRTSRTRVWRLRRRRQGAGALEQIGGRVWLADI